MNGNDDTQEPEMNQDRETLSEKIEGYIADEMDRVSYPRASWFKPAKLDALAEDFHADYASHLPVSAIRRKVRAAARRLS